MDDYLYNGVSVCITAYKAVDTLKETLDSVISQTWFKTNNNWEILLGIDHCEQTLEYTKTIMNNYKNLHVFMMDSNKGTYVTSNTLFKIAKYGNILRFDSDDIMFDSMIEELMNYREYDVQRFRLVNMKSKKVVTTYFSWGQQFVKKDIFEKFGGYRAWPCAGDAEFIKRIEKFTSINLLDKPLFLYRNRENSLTHDKRTSMNSNIRSRLIEFMNKAKYRNENEAKIECITNTYTEIFSDIYDYDPEIYIDIVTPTHCDIQYDPSKKVKRNLGYTVGSEIPSQKAVSVKIINKPVKRKIIASKVNLI